MLIPNNIQYILEKINQSESEWKALYMAVWHYAGYIDDKYIKKNQNNSGGFDYFVNEGTAKVIKIINTPASGTTNVIHVSLNKEPEEAVIKLQLPASKNGYFEWKIKEPYSILSSRDGQFTLGHLQTLFSLFEELLYEIAKTIFDKEIDTSKWVGIENFFDLEDFNKVLTSQEFMELKLAKETRNCFIHNGSKIDNQWLSAYQNARGNKVLLISLEGKGLGEGLSNIFYEIEDWNNLIVNISKKVKDRVLKKGDCDR